MSRRRDWRRSRAVEPTHPPRAGVRIWREAVDKRTGEVSAAPGVELSPVSLLMNRLYRSRPPSGWAQRWLRQGRREINEEQEARELMAVFYRERADEEEE